MGTMQAVGPLGQGRVEEAERGDGALERAGEGAADQAHPFADPEGARALQDDAGEDPAQRLLGGEAEQDRGEGAADREGAGVDAGDPQGQDHHRRHREQADHEAGGAGGRRVEPPVEARGEAARPSQWVAAEPTITRTTTVPIRIHSLVAGGDLGAVVSRRPASPRAPAAPRAGRRAPLARSAAPARRRGRATCQAWLRVSNSSRGSFGRRGVGIKIGYPTPGASYASSAQAAASEPVAQRREPLVAGGVDRDRLLRGR